MDDYSGTPIDENKAWQMFDHWRKTRCAIGVIFWGRTVNLYTLAVVGSAKNKRIQLKGEESRASFNLTGATFKYGPMQTWPRWPSPPIVEVTALRARFENSDYLALAEGLTPQPLPPVGLPGPSQAER